MEEHSMLLELLLVIRLQSSRKKVKEPDKKQISVMCTCSRREVRILRYGSAVY